MAERQFAHYGAFHAPAWRVLNLDTMAAKVGIEPSPFYLADKKMDELDHPQSSNNDTSLRPDSPCIGQCSTTYGDDVCKGCGRTYLEVINWIMFDDREKAHVWSRLEQIGLGSRR